jgi:hypothetical protein
MSSVKEQDLIAKRYCVACVEKTDPPEGAEGGTWYRYVIERGNCNSTIVGNRRGTLQQVTNHANAFADDLNSRSGVQGRSIWAPRQKK